LEGWKWKIDERLVNGNSTGNNKNVYVETILVIDNYAIRHLYVIALFWDSTCGAAILIFYLARASEEEEIIRVENAQAQWW